MRPRRAAKDNLPHPERAAPVESAQVARSWLVSARPDGETLVADARALGVRALLVGSLQGRTRREVEGRLLDIIETSAEAAERDAGPRPVPGLLHHTARHLLEWQNDLIRQGLGPVSSLIFFESDRLVGAAYGGGTRPSIWKNGQPLDVPWRPVLELPGLSIHGFSIYAGRETRIRLSWVWKGDPAGGAVEAEWPGGVADRPRAPSRAAPQVMAPQVVAPQVVAPQVAAPQVAAPQAVAPPDESKFQSWLDSVVAESQQTGSAPASPGKAEPARAVSQVPPTAPRPARLPARPARPAEPASAESVPPGGPAAAPDLEEIELPAPPLRSTRRVRPLRPVPPLDQDSGPSRWKGIWPVAAVIAVLFGAGWYLGAPRSGESDRPLLKRALRAVGLGGARFDVVVTSQPSGAWISADGKELARRTPATIELPAGTHQVVLSLPDLGRASFTVSGESGRESKLDAPLDGSLTVRSSASTVPIAVSVDGTDRGYAPLTVNDLAPGPHQVEFSGPGMAPWGQTIEVRVREERQLVARPFDSPQTGLIEVRGTVSGDQGTEELKGDPVWVDGVRRGVTPVTLELPSGPHSVRVEHHGEVPPVQVIDLPGGNQRFATFQFGTGIDYPRLHLLTTPDPTGGDQASVVTAALEGVAASQVREMWLHARTPQGVWRRYPMTMLGSPSGAVGTVVFPGALLDGTGRAPYYTSAMVASGDEYFTELANAGDRPGPRSGAPPRPGP